MVVLYEKSLTVIISYNLCLHDKIFAVREGARPLSRTLTGAMGVSPSPPPPLNLDPRIASTKNKYFKNVFG